MPLTNEQLMCNHHLWSYVWLTDELEGDRCKKCGIERYELNENDETVNDSFLKIASALYKHLSMEELQILISNELYQCYWDGYDEGYRQG
jgi:hypothetical protein